MISGVAATALWTAYCRAQESKRADPLVEDRLAETLCGDDGMSIGRAFEAAGGAHDAIIVRTRIIDDLVLAALARGVRTVASLGCGLCARPYRLDVPPGTRFVEIDLRSTMAWKTQRLERQFGLQNRPIARFMADLARLEEVEPALQAVGGDSALFVLEGVVQYLAPAVVRALFARIARRDSATTIVCDVGGGAWSRVFARRIPDAVARRGAPYVTRIDDPRSFFAPLGFDVTSDVSLVDWDARCSFPRWRTPWTSRLLPGFRSTARVIELAARDGRAK